MTEPHVPPGLPAGSPTRLVAAVAAIDAANADDPHRLVVDGVERPKEQAHAEMMTAWVLRLDPAASEVQVLAARAHHLRRWVLPRTDFPEGRAGYLRWRTELKRRHAADVAVLMQGAGYTDDEVEHVGRIIRKEGLRTDPEVQVHEDALCLVFLETQFADLIEKLGTDKAVDVVRKTVAKMSEAGVAAALQLSYSEAEQGVLEAATRP